MKRFAMIMLTVFTLFGCTDTVHMDKAMELRSRLQSAVCSFRVTVSADYGEGIHTFVMDCRSDASGSVTFSVSAPDTISGITGTLSGEKGFLTFDEEILAFSMLADGQLSPVSSPWILVNTLRSGFLRYCAETKNGYHLTVDDSYSQQAMQVDIWLDSEGKPVGAEILWQGRRILTLKVEDFVFV